MDDVSKDINIFNEWWEKNSERVLKEKEFLDAGLYFIAQQSFIAGLRYKNNG